MKSQNDANCIKTAKQLHLIFIAKHRYNFQYTNYTQHVRVLVSEQYCQMTFLQLKCCAVSAFSPMQLD